MLPARPPPSTRIGSSIARADSPRRPAAVSERTPRRAAPPALAEKRGGAAVSQPLRLRLDRGVAECSADPRVQHVALELAETEGRPLRVDVPLQHVLHVLDEVSRCFAHGLVGRRAAPQLRILENRTGPRRIFVDPSKAP